MQLVDIPLSKTKRDSSLLRAFVKQNFFKLSIHCTKRIKILDRVMEVVEQPISEMKPGEWLQMLL